MNRLGGSALAGQLLPFPAILLGAHLELGAMRSVGPASHALLYPSQHIETWLKSDKIHERSRAVQSVYLLLQYVVDSLKLAVSSLYPRTTGSTQWGEWRSASRNMKSCHRLSQSPQAGGVCSSVSRALTFSTYPVLGWSPSTR